MESSTSPLKDMFVHHVTTNLIIEVDDEAGTATSRPYYTVFQALTGFPLQPISTGRYNDRFERLDGRWRFLNRAVTTGMTVRRCQPPRPIDSHRQVAHPFRPSTVHFYPYMALPVDRYADS
jgi:hypothetical protein